MKQYAFGALLALGLGGASTVQADYFRDDFNGGIDGNIWFARVGDNGSPFGCTFSPNMITANSHGITLGLEQGQCSELQSRNLYRYGRVQGSLKTGNTPGTVASIFTYTSWWDEPGRAWQEIDIEFLPSRGNVVHTNVIYQPYDGTYESWEEGIDLTPYGLNIQQDLLTIGFEWGEQQIRWFVFDANGVEQTIRTVFKTANSGPLTNDQIPAYAWPVDHAKVMINHWHGDNSEEAGYFPGRYGGESTWAYYDFIEYIPH